GKQPQRLQSTQRLSLETTLRRALRVRRGARTIAPQAIYFTSPLRVRRDRAIFHDRHPDLIFPARLVAVDGEAAVLADRLEAIRRERDRGTVGVPARAVELEPDAV